MATAAILGAAPTLTSVVGLPALAGALANTDSDTLSLHKKRSTQIKYLHSMTKYTLHIWPNGTVNGKMNTSNTTRKYAMLEFITTFIAVNFLGQSNGETQDPRIQIRGVESKMWLCMNKRGVPYGSKHKTEDCEFHEQYDEVKDCYTYYSVQHPNNSDKTVKWYLALNRHGRTRVAMIAKHKSSRFKTTANHTRKDGPKVNIDIKPSGPNSNKSPRYTRISNTKPDTSSSSSGSRRTTKQRHIFGNRKPSKKGRKKGRLSDMLSSIEKALSVSSTEDSSAESFKDSMLIDLGGSNPFINLDTGDNIRHSSKKYKPSRKPRKRKKTYRRKPDQR